MQLAFDILEDPEAVLREQHFQAAQETLIRQIHAIPGNQLDMADSLHELLYRETTARNVFPELQDCKCDNQSDHIDIALRGNLSYEKGILVPDNETGTEVIETRIGVDRSRAFMEALPRAQHIAALRYAFSVRYHQLYTYLASPGNIDDISLLSNHISALHDMFERTIRAFIQER